MPFIVANSDCSEIKSRLASLKSARHVRQGAGYMLRAFRLISKSIPDSGCVCAGPPAHVSRQGVTQNVLLPVTMFLPERTRVYQDGHSELIIALTQ